MKTLSALVVCLVLGVCIDYTHSKRAIAKSSVKSSEKASATVESSEEASVTSESSSEGSVEVTGPKDKVTLLDFDGPRMTRSEAHDLAEILQEVYDAFDTDQVLAQKFADAVRDYMGLSSWAAAGYTDFGGSIRFTLFYVYYKVYDHLGLIRYVAAYH